MDARERAEHLRSDKVILSIDEIEQAITAAIEAERETCARIADLIRARELKKCDGLNFYHVVAEEVRDRILMRPATGNQDWSDWPELTESSEKGD